MADSTTAVASDGDSLCKFAVDAGFLNCDPLRADPANQALLNRPLVAGDIVTIPAIKPKDVDKASDAKVEFVKKGGPPPQIRFVHGSVNKSYKDDPDLDHLEVSKYITDKGGAPDGTVDFPKETQCEFAKPGDDDDDSFKVEVLDPANTGKEIDVILEALRPVYNPDKTVKEHKFFDGTVGDATTERGKRSLKVTAKKVGQEKTMRFRSPYLRLVVDEADKSGVVGALPPGTFPEKTHNQPLPKQTLLVTDMVDEGDEQVEILDQLVEARFEFKNCTQAGDKKCACRVRLPLGEDRQRVKLFVHIVRRNIGSGPMVTVANVKRRVNRWMRRIMAQASISPQLLDVKEVDPIENFLSVSCAPQNSGAGAGGKPATGDGTLGFTISATGQPTVVVGPITPPAGQSALDTAKALAALVTAPYTGAPFEVAVRDNDTLAAADLLIRGPAGANVVLSAIASNDTTQSLEAIRLNPLPSPIFETDTHNIFTGTVHERAFCRNYDTGDDRVDIFVVDTMDQNSRGEAMIPGRDTQVAPHQGLPGIFLTVFMAKRCIDGTDNDPIVLPHEVGHTVADVFHAVPTHHVMNGSVTGNVAVGGNKRIRDRPTDFQGTTVKHNFHLRYRSSGKPVLVAW